MFIVNNSISSSTLIYKDNLDNSSMNICYSYEQKKNDFENNST